MSRPTVFSRRTARLAGLCAAAISFAACSSSNTATSSTSTSQGESATSTSSNSPSTSQSSSEPPVSFTAEVWADNWFALYVNGELVGEDAVPITTERSFNAETISFRASYPLTIAVVAKDFKENDTGLEYIGTDRQQMGDGGFIAQIKEDVSGEVVVVTNAEWRGLVIHKAPTNKDCENSTAPTQDCNSEISQEPGDWKTDSFDDSRWSGADVYTASQVGAKDGYDTVAWDPSAALIWTSDLHADNTVLWRTVAQSP